MYEPCSTVIAARFGIDPVPAPGPPGADAALDALVEAEIEDDEASSDSSPCVETTTMDAEGSASTPDFLSSCISANDGADRCFAGTGSSARGRSTEEGRKLHAAKDSCAVRGSNPMVVRRERICGGILNATLLLLLLLLLLMLLLLLLTIAAFIPCARANDDSDEEDDGDDNRLLCPDTSIAPVWARAPVATASIPSPFALLLTPALALPIEASLLLL